MDDPVLLARVFRGGLLESEHRGAYVAVEGDRVVATAGDDGRPVFYRSASKPLQALGVVTSGAADRFGYGEEEIAITAGSHSATPAQVALVETMLVRAGLSAADLRCGGHWPYHEPTAARVRRTHERPLSLWNNCSGKHAGMLAAAVALGAPTDTYLDPAHPVQQRIHEHVAAFAGLARDDVAVAVDGCGAPTFAVPLVAMAQSLRRLGRPGDLPEALAGAARRVTAAAIRHPELVAGPGRFDTTLMSATTAPLLAKAGAEGVHGLVLPERDAALAVKVADGNMRGYQAFVVALLAARGWIEREAADAVRERLGLGVVTNHAGFVVGRVEPVLPTGRSSES